MRNVGRCGLAVSSLVFAFACDSPQAPDPTPGSPGWRDSQVIAVEEMVYRHQFDEHAPGARPGTVTFCLARQDETESLPWTDPPADLLRRFAGHVPAVKGVSQCRVDLGGDTDPSTGRPAIVFRVGPLRWQSDTEVVLDGGYHRGGLDASGQTYRVRYEGLRWRVVEVVWRWIS